MKRHLRQRAQRAALLVAFASCLLGAAPAYGGRLLATGHDADLHCAIGQPQCHFLKVAVDYVRGGAPNPSKPVLVLDKKNLYLQKALDMAFGAGGLRYVVMDPASSAFASTPLNTSTYSAMLVASDWGCGGCDLNDTGRPTDSLAISARKSAIAAFFNSGGGILALAGAAHGGAGSGDNSYYDFIPLPLSGAAVSPPFTLTAAGTALGFVSGDINCCAAHNSFNAPAPGSPLTVAETDSLGLAETLFGQGSISGGAVVNSPASGALPPAFGKNGVVGLPSVGKCLSKRHFKIHIRKDAGVTYKSVKVFVRGKSAGTIAGARLVAGVDLRGLPQGTFTVKIVVLTSTGGRIQGTRRYHTCATKRLPGHPHLL